MPGHPAPLRRQRRSVCGPFGHSSAAAVMRVAAGVPAWMGRHRTDDGSYCRLRGRSLQAPVDGTPLGIPVPDRYSVTPASEVTIITMPITAAITLTSTNRLRGRSVAA